MDESDRERRIAEFAARFSDRPITIDAARALFSHLERPDRFAVPCDALDYQVKYLVQVLRLLGMADVTSTTYDGGRTVVADRSGKIGEVSGREHQGSYVAWLELAMPTDDV